MVSGGSGRGEVSKHATYCTQGFDRGSGAYGCLCHALQPSIPSETALTIDNALQRTFCLELFERCRLCGEQKVMNSLTTPPSFWFVFQNESSEIRKVWKGGPDGTCFYSSYEVSEFEYVYVFLSMFLMRSYCSIYFHRFCWDF